MSIKANFKKFCEAKTTCEKHQALKDMETEVKRKFEKEIKNPIKSVISKVKENGIHIDITFGQKTAAKEQAKKASKKNK